jgi:hypothetical protein
MRLFQLKKPEQQRQHPFRDALRPIEKLPNLHPAA